MIIAYRLFARNSYRKVPLARLYQKDRGCEIPFSQPRTLSLIGILLLIDGSKDQINATILSLVSERCTWSYRNGCTIAFSKNPRFLNTRGSKLGRDRIGPFIGKILNVIG